MIEESGMHLVTGSERRVESMATMMRGGPAQGLVGWLLEAAARVMAGGWRRPAARRHMRVVETLAIGGKKQLVLVSCGGERFLVGTGADSVQTIVRVQAEAGASGSAVGTAAKTFGDWR